MSRNFFFLKQSNIGILIMYAMINFSNILSRLFTYFIYLTYFLKKKSVKCVVYQITTGRKTHYNTLKAFNEHFMFCSCANDISNKY